MLKDLSDIVWKVYYLFPSPSWKKCLSDILHVRQLAQTLSLNTRQTKAGLRWRLWSSRISLHFVSGLPDRNVLGNQICSMTTKTLSTKAPKMQFRARMKKAFGRNSESRSPSEASTTQSGLPIQYYKPGEVPRSKYRGPWNQEHQDKLHSFNFSFGRKTSFQGSEYSPAQTRAQSRRSSWISVKRPSTKGSGISGKANEKAHEKAHDKDTLRIDQLVENVGDDDILNGEITPLPCAVSSLRAQHSFSLQWVALERCHGHKPMKSAVQISAKIRQLTAMMMMMTTTREMHWSSKTRSSYLNHPMEWISHLLTTNYPKLWPLRPWHLQSRLGRVRIDIDSLEFSTSTKYRLVNHCLLHWWPLAQHHDLSQYHPTQQTHSMSAVYYRIITVHFPSRYTHTLGWYMHFNDSWKGVSAGLGTSGKGGNLLCVYMYVVVAEG